MPPNEPSGSSPTRVGVLTLGCRLNQAESEETLRALRDSGIHADEYVARGDLDEADVVVVNTCTVTADASRSSRKLIRKATQGGARVVVTGCYAVAAPDVCADVPGVVAVVPNKDKDELAATVAALPGVVPAAPEGVVPDGPPLQVRGAYKVQTGCDVGCTYCIIPTTRGALESRGADEVVEGARRQVAAGIREVALTGVHLGKYGVDRAESGALATLVRRVLDEVPELPWLRLSSLEANTLDDALLELVATEPRVCKHLHIPLQSGSDRVLAEMGRPYDTASFAQVVRRVRDVVGTDCGLTTDLLVGFPGEDDAAFASTLAFAEECAFTKLHVFRYSPQPGTAAATRRDHLPEEAKRARAAELRRLGDHLAAQFHAGFVGRPLATMVESAGPSHDGSDRPQLLGTATNYVKVAAAGPAGLVGRVVAARVLSSTSGGVSAELEDTL